METGEGSKPKFIEIEASEKLDRGQNFYDQPPFAQVVSELAEKYTLSVSAIRYILSAAASRIDWMGTDAFIFDDPRRGLTSFTVHMIYDNFPPRFKPSPNEREKNLKVIGDTVSRLGEYHLWYEYIKEARHIGNYKNDGDFFTRPRETLFDTPLTYAAWVTRKLRNNQRQKLLGLAEVLPQGFSSETPASPKIALGKKPGTRRWRILAASELILPRK